MSEAGMKRTRKSVESPSLPLEASLQKKIKNRRRTAAETTAESSSRGSGSSREGYEGDGATDEGKHTSSGAFFRLCSSAGRLRFAQPRN